MRRLAAPAFWDSRPGLAALALSPLAALYGAVAARRLGGPGTRAPVPVLCIGNPTLGGAGKTPTALALAALLERDGRRPGFLTRGHGGRLAGPVLVDPAAHTARDVGDEALLLAAQAPAIVARDRPAGAALLAGLGRDVVVMDDGFQNPSLVKDFALLVLDGEAGVGNGRVFPAGPLRAPLSAQLARADAILVVGDGRAEAAVAAGAGLPVFRAALAPVGAEALRGVPALAFCGIGRPQKFWRSLEEAGVEVVERRAFPDHHDFSGAECASLLARAKARGLVPVTTAKDAARLAGRAGATGRLGESARVLRVALRFAEPEALLALVLARLGSAAALLP